MTTTNALYEGTIRHRRFSPFEHEFTYSLFMLYIELSKLDSVFDDIPGWSSNGPAPAWFKREDHTGRNSQSLEASIRETVEEETGEKPKGPIRLLTHLRYFGYVFNPVSFYFCFDETDSEIKALVPEVSNTPWGDMFTYVLPTSEAKQSNNGFECYFDKSFYVSPFMPPDLGYRLEFSEPNSTLNIHMDCYREGNKNFDATLNMESNTMNRSNLLWKLIETPLMTTKIIAGIYYEALKIWFKKSSFYPHPQNGLISSERQKQ